MGLNKIEKSKQDQLRNEKKDLSNMSDKLRLRKRFLALWARIALNMLPIAGEENMNATKTTKRRRMQQQQQRKHECNNQHKKVDEDESKKEDVRFILLEIIFDLCPKMFNRVVAIQLRTILALWPAISSVKLNIQKYRNIGT